MRRSTLLRFLPLLATLGCGSEPAVEAAARCEVVAHLYGYDDSPRCDDDGERPGAAVKVVVAERGVCAPLSLPEGWSSITGVRFTVTGDCAARLAVGSGPACDQPVAASGRACGIQYAPHVLVTETDVR